MKGIFRAAKDGVPAVEFSLVILNIGLLAAIVVPAIHG